MSCGCGVPTFRLLDGLVGWNEGANKHQHKHLTNLEGTGGLMLAQIAPGAADPGAILAYIPPPLLARGCGPCDWFLLTPCPPATRLLRRDVCRNAWLPVWSPACNPGMLIDPVALAVRRSLIAIADRGAQTVWVWAGTGKRLIAAIKVDGELGPIAFTPWSKLLVTIKLRSSWVIRRFGPTGDACGELTNLPSGDVDRIAVGKDCAIWLVMRDTNGLLSLWRAAHNRKRFKPIATEKLASAFSPTALKAASAVGFCLEEGGPDGLAVINCFSWYGRPVCEAEIIPQPPPDRFKAGQLLTDAIDSGMARCRWHRVRIDADVPPGTTLSVAVSTSESDDAEYQGDHNTDPVWKKFPAGKPHPADWQTAPTGALEFLID